MGATPKRKGALSYGLGGPVNGYRQPDRHRVNLGGYAPRDLKVALGGLRKNENVLSYGITAAP